MTIADKLALIARNVQKVFDKGFIDGKQAEYDAFWDVYQRNGGRAQYGYAFGGNGWTEDTFKPKYPIIAKGSANYMFGNSELQNIKKSLLDSQVTIDFSNVSSMYAVFMNASLNTNLPEINMSNATDIRSCFHTNSALTSIDRVVFSEKITQLSSAFQNCKSLESITFDGTLACSGLDVKSCPLSRDSLLSLIAVLKEYTDGSTHTITLGAANLAKLTDAEKAIATEKGWTLT